MKKVFLLLLCLVCITGLVNAKIVKDSLYEIPKTSIVPTIDGVEDSVWMTLDWNKQRLYTVDGTPADSGLGIAGQSKAMWDANNLYILFYTCDDVVVDIPTNANWNNDAVEIYVDGDNSKIPDGVAPDPGGGLAPGDYQFTIPHWYLGMEATSLGLAFGNTFDTTGCEYKIADVGDAESYFPGFLLEVKIPLASLGIDGSIDDQLIGWELQQDESDDATAGRQSMTKWWSPSNNSWTDASLWGTAILSSRPVDGILEWKKISTAPVIDGLMDDLYKDVNPVTTNKFRVDLAADPANTDPMFGGFITAYPAYDETNFYILIDVVDQIITDIPTNANWNNDAIEIYFDGDNSKIPDGVAPDPGGGLAPGDYQFTIPHWYMGMEATSLGLAFGNTFDTTGCEYKITDRDARYNSGMLTQEGSGYNVEIKIPLASLGIDGTVSDAPVGFELQLDNSNDATAGRQGMEKWWNYSNNSWTDASIWGTAKLGTATGVAEQPKEVAQSYKLNQNYPNPFNPSTEITFTLTKSANVKLNVYNLLGKKVAELVNGKREAGFNKVTFNAKNLASGVYFYKLEAGNTTLAKKMMLLK
jgi:hypothetical protein